MAFNELNAVEHFIIQKLSGVNLNVPPPASGRVGMPAEALIRLNPEIAANPASADEVLYPHG